MKTFTFEVPTSDSDGERKDFASQDKEKIPIDVPDLEDIESKLRASIIGQKNATKNFAELKKIIESGIRPPKGPIDVEWLSGPSGVGKTEMVKKIIDLMLEDNPQYDEDGRLIKNPGSAERMIRIDGGSYQSDHEIAKVLGSPPGYVGSGGPGNSYVEPILSQANIEKNSIYYTDEQGNERKVCFILIDEAEKANQALYKTLLSALDDGVLTLGNNEKVDLSDCVFFFTSNLGNREVIDARKNGDKRSPEEIYRENYKKHFPPEFLGRIRKMTVFEHLTREEIAEIVKLRLCEIEKVFALNDIHVNLEITEEAVDWLVNNGYSKEEGARAMQKLMDDTIQRQLVLISGQYVIDNKNIVVSLNAQNNGLEFLSEGDPEKKPASEHGKPPRKKPQGNGEKEDALFRFVSDNVNEMVRKTLDKESMRMVGMICDNIKKRLIERKGLTEQIAKQHVANELKSNFNSFTGRRIETANDLADYLRNYFDEIR